MAVRDRDEPPDFRAWWSICYLFVAARDVGTTVSTYVVREYVLGRSLSFKAVLPVVQIDGRR